VCRIPAELLQKLEHGGVGADPHSSV